MTNCYHPAQVSNPHTIVPRPGSTVEVFFTLGDEPDTLPSSFIATGFDQRVTYVPGDELIAIRLSVENAEEALRQAGIAGYGTLAEGVRMLAARDPAAACAGWHDWLEAQDKAALERIRALSVPSGPVEHSEGGDAD